MEDEAPSALKIYMPPNPTEKQIQMALSLCADENTVSDESGMSNRDKWEKVMDIFDTNSKATLFSQIDFLQTYMTDDARLCEGAMHICDLRRQYLRRLLSETPNDPVLHVCWTNNTQAHVPLRERVRLGLWQQAARKVTKAH